MGLFSKSKEKTGVQCPACGSYKTAIAKGTQAVVMAYPGFYSGVSDNSESGGKLWICKDCKNVFRVE